MNRDDIKKMFETELEKVKTAVESSSVVDSKKNLGIAVEKAKVSINQYVDSLQMANTKLDAIIDPLLERAQKSRVTPLLVAFLILSAISAGIAIGTHL